MSPSDAQRWDEKWRGRHTTGEPPDWLGPFDEVLPRAGRALDVACGAGRGALFWARRGMEVTGVDVSEVGLDRARARLAEDGHRLVTCRRDLESGALPEGPWDGVSVLHYRPGPLWAALRNALAPGGVLVVEVLHVRQLERHARPSRRWLAEPGEIAEGLGNLEVLYLEEGWFGDRALARAVARQSPG